MKCHDAEKLMLMQHSGSISDRKRCTLAAHLNTCASCGEFLQGLTAAQRAVEAREEPSALIIQNVLREARIAAPERGKTSLSGLRPAMAMAASLLIVLALFFTAYSPDRVGMEMIVTEAQLLNTEDQITSVMYSGLSEDDLAFNFFMTYEGNGQG